MRLVQLSIVAALAGSNWASGQGGFIIHLDDLQAGRAGAAVSVREVGSGYLLFSGQFSQEFPTKPHIYLRNLNPNGLVQQEHEYLIGVDRGFDIGYIDAVATVDNDTFAAIIDEGRDFASRKMFYRFNSLGDTIERRILMAYPEVDSIAQAIRQLRRTSTGFVFCGFHEPPSALAKALLGTLDHNGDTLWTRCYDVNGFEAIALGVEEYSDGGCLLTGYRTGAPAINTSFLIRTDVDGDQLWLRTYGNRAAVNGAVRVAADGGIITWSEYREDAWPGDWQQMMLTKWNENGGIVWQKRSHYDHIVATYDFEILPDGSMIATGATEGEGRIMKFSAEGDSLWSRPYSYTHSLHLLYDVQPTSDGGFVATGTAYRYEPLDPQFQTNQMIWVVKTDSLGCVVPGCQNVGVQEYALDMNEHLQVWPNPVGDWINITFSPPAEFTQQGALRITVQDALGREVIRNPFTAQPIDVQHLPAGTYHVHLSDGKRWLAGRSVVKE